MSERGKAWALTAVEQFCRELPMKARNLESVSTAEARRRADEYVRTIRLLLDTIVEPNERR